MDWSKLIRVNFLAQCDLKHNETALKSCHKGILEELYKWLKTVCKDRELDLAVAEDGSDAVFRIDENRLGVFFDGVKVRFSLNGKQVDKSEIYGASYNTESGKTTGIKIDLETIKTILIEWLR